MGFFLRLCVSLALAAAPLAAFQEQGHGALRDRLEGLLRVSDPSAGFLAVALGIAFLAGAAHALTPGHGKALVAAYLAGSRGTVWDAVYLGSVVTITHTASVFLLGLAALYASQHIQMEKVFAFLSIVSGLIIVIIGGGTILVALEVAALGRSGRGPYAQPFPRAVWASHTLARSSAWPRPWSIPTAMPTGRRRSTATRTITRMSMGTPTTTTIMRIPTRRGTITTTGTAMTMSTAMITATAMGMTTSLAVTPCCRRALEQAAAACCRWGFPEAWCRVRKRWWCC